MPEQAAAGRPARRVKIADARSVYVARTYAYVAGGKQGLVIVDVERPEQPRHRSDVQRRRRDERRERRQGGDDQRVACSPTSPTAKRPAGRCSWSRPTRPPGAFGFSPRPTPKLIADYHDPRAGAGDLEGPRSRSRGGRERQPGGGLRPPRRPAAQSARRCGGCICATVRCGPSPTSRRARPLARAPTLDDQRCAAPVAEPRPAESDAHGGRTIASRNATGRHRSFSIRRSQLPEVLDALIVGGGPFGTAAAFRAQRARPHGAGHRLRRPDEAHSRLREGQADPAGLRRRRSHAVPERRRAAVHACSSRRSTRTRCA